jgi:hypothetical protein
MLSRRSRHVPARAVAAAVAALSLLGLARPASAQPLPVHQLTTQRAVSLNIDSSAEFPIDHDGRTPFQGYAPNLDQRRRILANPWVRGVTLTGVDNWYLANWYLFSEDECQENRIAATLPPGVPCTAVPANDVDRMTLAWADGTSTVTRVARQFNGDSTFFPFPMTLSTSGTRSLANPGARLRMVSGPAVLYDAPPRWSTLGNKPDGEWTGFKTESLTLVPGPQGDSTPVLLSSYERVTGVLMQPADTVTFRVPGATDTRTTVALWLDMPPGESVWPSVEVRAKCGGAPHQTGWDYKQTFSAGTAFLDLYLQGSVTCPTDWYVSVTSASPHDVVFHARASRHYLDKRWSNLTVGTLWMPSATERTNIRNAMREAAWKTYGMTGGTHLLKSFNYTWGSCNGVDFCWRGFPATCNGMNANTGLANHIDNTINICWPTPVSGVQSMAALMAHEMGHIYAGLGDEYWRSNDFAKICDQSGVTILRCTHTTMSITWDNDITSLCNDRTHTSYPEMRIQTFSGGMYQWPWVGGVRGNNTISECADGSTNTAGPHGDDAWQQIAGRVPVSHSAVSTPDNHHFRNFAAASARIEIGRNLD